MELVIRVPAIAAVIFMFLNCLTANVCGQEKLTEPELIVEVGTEFSTVKKLAGTAFEALDSNAYLYRVLKTDSLNAGVESKSFGMPNGLVLSFSIDGKGLVDGMICMSTDRKFRFSPARVKIFADNSYSLVFPQKSPHDAKLDFSPEKKITGDTVKIIPEAKPNEETDK